MKIYTEEQLRDFIDRNGCIVESDLDEKQLTPTELPTDDEIKQLNPYPFASSGSNLIWYFGAKDIVNWMRNKIQGGEQ